MSHYRAMVESHLRYVTVINIHDVYGNDQSKPMDQSNYQSTDISINRLIMGQSRKWICRWVMTSLRTQWRHGITATSLRSISVISLIFVILCTSCQVLLSKMGCFKKLRKLLSRRRSREEEGTAQAAPRGRGELMKQLFWSFTSWSVVTAVRRRLPFLLEQWFQTIIPHMLKCLWNSECGLTRLLTDILQLSRKMWFLRARCSC